MDNSKHHYYDCRFYKAYFTKGLCKFDRLDYGVCSIRQEQLQEKHDICALWASNNRKQKTCKVVAGRILVQMAEDISILTQILSEEE